MSMFVVVGSHGLLRQGNEEYDAKRVALYEHYHPIEICPDIPLPEKAKLMEERYYTTCITVLFDRCLLQWSSQCCTRTHCNKLK